MPRLAEGENTFIGRVEATQLKVTARPNEARAEGKPRTQAEVKFDYSKAKIRE